MDQEEYDWGPFTPGEMEDILQESGMEKTNRWIKRMQQRKEAASRSRTKSPVAPRSRSSSADRGGARSQTYSGRSLKPEVITVLVKMNTSPWMKTHDLTVGVY